MVRGRAVSVQSVLGLVLLLVGLLGASASAQVGPHTDPKFKCPNKNQKPFCLKNNSKSSVIVTGVTVYRGVNRTGDHHQLTDASNGGDDVPLAPGKHACWCASFKPKSYKVTVLSPVVAAGFPGGSNGLIVADIDETADIPLFSGGAVTLLLEPGLVVPDGDEVQEIWVMGGESSDFPGVTFLGENGDPYEGLLLYIGSAYGETDDEAIVLETPDPKPLY